jgi:flagellar motor protein MotB
MAKNPKPPEEDCGESAPIWIISFADMISLLMAFFVMLSTFADFGPRQAEKLRKIGRAALSPDFYGGWHEDLQRAAVGPQMPAAGQGEKGSEKPTLEPSPSNDMLAETKPQDFRSRKIFLVKSKKMFWAAGTKLSSNGRDFLDTFISYINGMPDQIVISENGPGDNPELGMLRAVIIVDYLSNKGISKNRFNVAARGMLPDDNFKTERMLEISLLDENTYK